MVASALAISRSLAYRCIGLVMAHLPVGQVTCEPGSDPVYLRPMRDIETIDSELRLLFPRVAGSGRPHRNRDHDQGAPGSRFMTTEG
jgi:hypothetical protein